MLIMARSMDHGFKHTCKLPIEAGARARARVGGGGVQAEMLFIAV